MDIQSLSVVVPTKRCVNNCPFCVSKMHDSPYENEVNWVEHRRRLKFARDNNCNTMLITGTAEPGQNKLFLGTLLEVNNNLDKPFRWIEFQTTGVFLEDEFLAILKLNGVSTISLSVSDLFDCENNMKIIGVPEHLKFDLGLKILQIKSFGFNVRLSLNLIDTFSGRNAKEIFDELKRLDVDQVTFREMYGDNNGSNESKWVLEHAIDMETLVNIENYIKENGTKLEKLPFGEWRYSVDGISTVLDSDCMAKDTVDVIKSLILRPNSKLYTKWNDKGSLLF